MMSISKNINIISKVTLLAGIAFVHFLFVSPVYSSDDWVFKTFPEKKKKVYTADQARQEPREFAYMADTKEGLYVSFINSAKDIKDEDCLERKYTLVKIKRVLKIVEEKQRKFNQNYKLFLENVDGNRNQTLKSYLHQIDPYAIIYKPQGEDDSFTSFIEMQKALYDIQLAMLHDGTLDLSDEVKYSDSTVQGKSSTETPEEESVFQMQLEELGCYNKHSTSSHVPIINSETAGQIDSDEEYARMLHQALNGEDWPF